MTGALALGVGTEIRGAKVDELGVGLGAVAFGAATTGAASSSSSPPPPPPPDFGAGLDVPPELFAGLPEPTVT